MKVVILCGGMGARLREETEFRPKPMVKIGAYPILWHIMKHYAHYGFNHFILCLGYKGEVIKEYFYHYMLHNNDVTIKLGKNRQVTIHDNHETEDWEITLVDTGESALKGARIYRVMDYVDDDFMVTYGDGVSDIDLNSLVDYHKNHGKIATVTGVSPCSTFGQIHAENSRVVEFHEKPQIKEGIINGGFFVFNKKIFNYLNEDETCDLEMGVLEKLTDERQLMVFRHEGNWACMDTYRDTIYLNQLWENGKAFWKVWH